MPITKRRSLSGIVCALLLSIPAHAQFSDGVLDTSFDGDGIVQTDFGNNLEDQANAVAVQADGKTVVAGYSLVAGKYQVALVRYTIAGALDTTFGTNGRALFDVGPDHDAANAVAVQPDGKIVVAGFTYGAGGFEFLVMRLTNSGVLDPTFGTGGKATLALSPIVNIASALAIDGGGRIVVAGFASIAGGQDFVVLRYTSAGVLDTTFSGDGIAFTNLGGTTEQVSAVVIQPDGKIIAAGFSSQGAWADTAMVRYTEAGGLDAGFGSGGKVLSSLSGQDDYALSMALTNTGDILLAGSAANGTGFTDAVITRYSSAGIYDGSFGTWRASSLGASIAIRSLALQSNGHIVYAGNTSSGGGRLFLGRILGSGVFGQGVSFPYSIQWPMVGTGSSEGRAVAIHNSGRIAAVGRSTSSLGGADFTTWMLRVPLPDIAVAHSSPLSDGAGTISLGAAIAGQDGVPVTFTITNPGDAELNNLAIAKGGTDADDFDVSALSATSIPAGGGSVTFTVTFSPSIAGVKNVALQITSNVSGPKNPFDVALTAMGLSTAQDTDNDGLNDVAEFQMAALGFNWQVAQASLVGTYHSTANGAGLFNSSQVGALRLPTPEIRRNPATSVFTLRFGLEKTTTTPTGGFEPFPISAPQTTIESGKLTLQFTSPDAPAFFRILSK